MFEYELDSQQGDEERKEFDYDFSKEEFLNPILVKGPDGSVSIGTESKIKRIKRPFVGTAPITSFIEMEPQK